jgi:hypothetical protein
MNRLYPNQKVDVTKIDENFQEICANGWVTEDRIAVNSVTASKLVNGAATDIKIGTRTMSDTTEPTSKEGYLQDHLNNIGYMLKSITGKDDCITVPDKSIADLVAPHPIARVTMSSAQTITTTPAKVQFDTKTFDVGDYFDTTTYQYTPPAGYYRVTVTGCIRSSGGTLTRVTLQILKNNDSYYTIAPDIIADSSDIVFSISDIIQVDGNDKLDFGAVKAATAATVAITYCVITFEKISD